MMFRNRIWTLLCVPTLLVGALGCSDSTDPSTPDGGELVRPPSNATIKITSPAEGDTVAIDSALSFAVTYEVSGFTLKPAGTCGDEVDCGHVEILVDAYQCSAPGENFNTSSDSTSALIQLQYCAAAAGAHTITAELHYDDGSAVVGPSGKYVSQSITVTAAPPPPAIAIVSPAVATAFIGDDADRTLDIGFSTTSLTLVPEPGMCNGDPACGVLIVNIDGDACDDPGAPAPVNNYGSTGGSIAAKFGFCATPTGGHTVTLTVLDDSASGPVMVNDQPLMASVTVDTYPKPVLAITSPAEGDSVTMGTDAKQTVSIGFSMTNLTLEPYPGEGTCSGNPGCGVLTVNIDGDTCNDPGAPAPLNNYGATSSPIDAYFAMCPTPAGEHTVTLTVLDDNGEKPVMVNGTPLSSEIHVTTN